MDSSIHRFWFRDKLLTFWLGSLAIHKIKQAFVALSVILKRNKRLFFVELHWRNLATHYIERLDQAIEFIQKLILQMTSLRVIISYIR